MLTYGLFLSSFQFYHFSSTIRNNIYHILYEILFEIHIHKLFNQRLFLSSFVDNCFITFLMLLIILFEFVIMICVSYRLVHDVSYLSVRELCIFSGLSSFSSFLNDLNPGINRGPCGGRHCIFGDQNFLSRFRIGSFLGDNVASDFSFSFFLSYNVFTWRYTRFCLSCQSGINR